MEQKDIALKASLANKLATLVYSHQLPVNLIVRKPIDHLRAITITYHEWMNCSLNGCFSALNKKIFTTKQFET